MLKEKLVNRSFCVSKTVATWSYYCSYYGFFDTTLMFVMNLPTQDNNSYISQNTFANDVRLSYLSFTIVLIFSNASSLLLQQNVCPKLVAGYSLAIYFCGHLKIYFDACPVYLT